MSEWRPIATVKLLRPGHGVFSALGRGIRGLCPRCGEGPLFRLSRVYMPDSSDEIHGSRALERIEEIRRLRSIESTARVA